MKPSSVLVAAAALASGATADAGTTVVISNGVTTTYVLPNWPSAGSANSAATATVTNVVPTTATATVPAGVTTAATTLTSNGTHPSPTYVTAAAEGLAFDRSMMGLVVFCVLGVFML